MIKSNPMTVEEIEKWSAAMLKSKRYRKARGLLSKKLKPIAPRKPEKRTRDARVNVRVPQRYLDLMDRNRAKMGPVGITRTLYIDCALAQFAMMLREMGDLRSITPEGLVSHVNDYTPENHGEELSDEALTLAHYDMEPEDLPIVTREMLQTEEV